MSRIEWRPINAPSFGESNALRKAAMDSMNTGLGQVAQVGKDLQSIIRKNNMGALQQYVNQAATPEQMQDATFQQGYQNLMNSLGNEYDAQEAVKYVDTRGDTLRQRALAELNLQKTRMDIDHTTAMNPMAQAAAQLNLDSERIKYDEEKANIARADAYRKAMNIANPIQREAKLAELSAQGLIDPDAVLNYKQGLANLNNTEQQTSQNAQLFPSKLRQANATADFTEANAQGQKIENSVAQSAAELSNTTNGLNLEALKQLNGVGQRSNNFTKNVNTLTSQLPRINQYNDLIEASAARHGVPANLIRAMMSAESSGYNIDPKTGKVITSPKNAQGLMQLIPATAARFGVKDVADPAQNIEGGAKYLAWLLARYKGDERLALAAYNAGEGNVDKHKGIPPFKETQNYVPKIMDMYYALSSGNDGTEVRLPNTMQANGKSGTGGSGKAKTPTEIQMWMEYEKAKTTNAEEAAKRQAALPKESMTQLANAARDGWFGLDSRVDGIVNAINNAKGINNLSEDEKVLIFKDMDSTRSFTGGRYDPESAKLVAQRLVNERIQARKTAENQRIAAPLQNGIRQYMQENQVTQWQAAQALNITKPEDLAILGIKDPNATKQGNTSKPDATGLKK